jgi:hypothetical protein
VAALIQRPVVKVVLLETAEGSQVLVHQAAQLVLIFLIEIG